MIYLIRHGETEANIANIWQGQTGNGPLNEKGQDQAQKVAIYLSDKNIEKVITSDLLRAKQTADEISSRLDVELIVDKNLREMSYGELEGLDNEEVHDEYGQLISKWFHQPENTLFPDGESYKDVNDRAKKVVQNYFYSDKNIVLVSHGDMIRAIITAISGKSSEFHFPQISNTSITTFVNEGGKILIKNIAETPHL